MQMVCSKLVAVGKFSTAVTSSQYDASQRVKNRFYCEATTAVDLITTESHIVTESLSLSNFCHNRLLLAFLFLFSYFYLSFVALFCLALYCIILSAR